MKAFCVALLLLLGGCAAVTAPMGAMPQTPALADSSFITQDGLSLPLRHWGPLEHPRAIIIALHGMSDYSNAFAMPGAEWSKREILTLAYDQRGFGAGPNPGLWAGADAMRRDLADAVAAAHRRWPAIPVFALGESMGGAVLLTAMASVDGPAELSGAILVAPAVWSRADMPALYRVALFLAAHLMPGMNLSNNAASHVVTIIPSDNIAMLRALGRDPLFQKRTRADTLFGLVNLMDEARGAAPQAAALKRAPILMAYGAKDQVIPAAPTAAVAAALDGSATVQKFPEGYHMLLRDLEGPKVDAEIADWIDRTLGAPATAP